MNIIEKLWFTITFPIWAPAWTIANGLVVFAVVTARTAGECGRMLKSVWMNGKIR